MLASLERRPVPGPSPGRGREDHPTMVPLDTIMHASGPPVSAVRREIRGGEGGKPDGGYT
ncbi:hypothetical protein GCM10017673_11690 [Streptosporangium violaceochromogenes]|nr:hypothetical protein GCM10017673_11690 [Streptosporangium violaceochromogenes]